ncbi:MAG: cation:dicarboxylase symporter family transporter, partial [Acidobacteriota bacterium]|nr:cation:dicarboxylase symporter family transporter [Acidobacteriota bacterium]
MAQDNDNVTQNGEEEVIPDDAYSQELGTDLDDDTPDKPKGIPLHTKILIGLIIGVVAGLGVNFTLGGENPNVMWVVENFTRPVGQLFLNLLLMIVVPLVFSSLVVGIAGIGDIRKLGRIGAKSFGYTLVISAISVFIGLTLANTIQPGKRVDPETNRKLQAKYGSEAGSRVAATINVPAESAAFAANIKSIAGRVEKIAGTVTADSASARAFSKTVGEFVPVAEKFAEEIPKSNEPAPAFYEKAAELTKAADAVSARTDLLAIEAGKVSGETKRFVSSIKSAIASQNTALMEVVTTIVPRNVFNSI